MEKAIFFILLITVLGTFFGSLLGIIRKPSHKFMHYLLAFAGGVLISVAFLELIPASIEFSSVFVVVGGIVLGSLLIYFIGRMIVYFDPRLDSQDKECRLKRASLYLILGVFLHNFPVGMAIAIGTVTEIKLSLVIALAIAVHNIPEGIYTAAPYFKVTGSRFKAFLISFSTIVPLIVGFIVAFFIFKNISGNVLGLIIGLAAGVMIYVSADELIPRACSENKGSGPLFALILGILFVILLEMI